MHGPFGPCVLIFIPPTCLHRGLTWKRSRNDWAIPVYPFNQFCFDLHSLIYLGGDDGGWVPEDVASEDGEGGVLLLAGKHQAHACHRHHRNQCHHFRAHYFPLLSEAYENIFTKIEMTNSGVTVLVSIVSWWQSHWAAPLSWCHRYISAPITSYIL